ncbi:hypothetical protein [Pasteurella multocida]|uniref:hypothetical protein n=1 Tax=Pasteurella multocida TaxID=747 RepID=UPI001119531C|nr:hypothetical protein [Pasteurella multocida]QDA12847.1 hypothetical protein E0L18_08390 [Pasteurella multocida subsp. multocida]
MAIRSQFRNSEIGHDPNIDIQYQNQGLKAPSSNINSSIKQERLKDSKANRNLRICYAVIAVCFAIASIIFWMRFIQFYYDPKKTFRYSIYYYNKCLYCQYFGGIYFYNQRTISI